MRTRGKKTSHHLIPFLNNADFDIYLELIVSILPYYTFTPTADLFYAHAQEEVKCLSSHDIASIASQNNANLDISNSESLFYNASADSTSFQSQHPASHLRRILIIDHSIHIKH